MSCSVTFGSTGGRSQPRQNGHEGGYKTAGPETKNERTKSLRETLSKKSRGSARSGRSCLRALQNRIGKPPTASPRLRLPSHSRKKVADPQDLGAAVSKLYKTGSKREQFESPQDAESGRAARKRPRPREGANIRMKVSAPESRWDPGWELPGCGRRQAPSAGALPVGRPHGSTAQAADPAPEPQA